jgi:hypothetical protein
MYDNCKKQYVELCSMYKYQCLTFRYYYYTITYFNDSKIIMKFVTCEGTINYFSSTSSFFRNLLSCLSFGLLSPHRPTVSFIQYVFRLIKVA